MKITQTWQKSYVKVRRINLKFDVHDWAYLEISTMKGFMSLVLTESLVLICRTILDFEAYL